MLRILPAIVLLWCTGTTAADLAARRGEFLQALQLAERGSEAHLRPAMARLVDHPLYGYLEYTRLERRMAQADAAQVQGFLQDHATLPVARSLHRAWLRELIRRQDWKTYRAFAIDSEDPLLACGNVRARLAVDNDAAALDAAQTVWLSGRSLPELCDPAFAALERAGRIDADLRWQRIALALEARNTALVRHLARGLPPEQASRALAYAGFVEKPTEAAAQWKPGPVARRTAVLGLSHLAQSDPGRAEQLAARIAGPLRLDAAQRGQIAAAVALWSAASYLPDSARRLSAVPDDARDERLREWRVREALAREDTADVLAALAAMPAGQRQAPRWRYVHARMLERRGQATQARALLEPLAMESNFHGFLAADRLGRDYALCPLEPPDDAAARRQVAAQPGLVRALELYAIDRKGWAVAEWSRAVEALDADGRRLAVALADAVGWHDRAAFTLNSDEDLRLYRLRFPLAYTRELEQHAQRHALDPAWVAALIRAESAWNPQARSPADARGLMQLLPATGRQVARELGVPWPGPAGLLRPVINIELGTAYLRAMLDRFGGHPTVATAAYNAGPAPAARWQGQRPLREVDLWIETIPYHETREYVARVMAFSVIYDWRLSGAAVPLSARLTGAPVDAVPRRGFNCPPERIAAAQP
ncbi:MAG TPA: transglycosylase SLT domain-containing protein [Xanthomonadaceae bacterium]|nr:transglycosylase SLT domain-containing protein [Xanthomonadaceae bacterium]